MVINQTKKPFTKNKSKPSPTLHPHEPKLVLHLFLPAQEKLKNKKFPSLQKNKTLRPHKPRQTVTNFYGGQHTIQYLRSFHGDTADRKTEALGGNSTLPKLAVQWLNQVQIFNQTFVQVDSDVLRNRQLRQAAKRYLQA